MKIIDNNDNYKFIQLTHVAASFFGLPYTRRPIKKNDKLETDLNIAGTYNNNVFCYSKK